MEIGKKKIQGDIALSWSHPISSGFDWLSNKENIEDARWQIGYIIVKTYNHDVHSVLIMQPIKKFETTSRLNFVSNAMKSRHNLNPIQWATRRWQIFGILGMEPSKEERNRDHWKWRNPSSPSVELTSRLIRNLTNRMNI